MLQLFSIFHLNLAYSSIEEAQRPEVVRRCYWPLLRLAERTGAPIGIEATGFTLERAAAADPAWLAALRALIERGQCEFVGSGYAQVIGPLVPAAVNAANLRIGHAVYERLLGFRPRLAFVNEQAYSAGLIQHYLDAGYAAMVMEWDNPARAHPEWDADLRYYPQIAAGQHGESIPLLWNKAIAFQQFQRYAHGESSLAEYVDYLSRHVSADPRALAIYGNDAEVFDFRPGRYRTEAALAGDSEWDRIEELYVTIARDDRFALVRPSEVLALAAAPMASRRLQLESAHDPTPVKKQRKYNITRWAVTGRDDVGINTACWRRYEQLAGDASANDEEWRELCELWSSDYRTHITEARWADYRERLDRVASRSAEAFALRSEGRSAERPALDGRSAEAFALRSEAAPDIAREPQPSDGSQDVARRLQPSVQRDGSFITLQTEGVTLVLNARRGLAIHSLAFADAGGDALCGTLKHGYYDDIHWGADFYSAMVVFESPGHPKLTDLNLVEPTVREDESGGLAVEATQPTDFGPMTKTIRAIGSAVELSYRFEWAEIPIGSLRLGDITLRPDAFDRASLFYRTHNGGVQAETFPLDGTRVAHGDAVSFLVSASHAVGVTDGTIALGDRRRALHIDVDRTSAALVGMITYQPVRDTYFCRVSFSAAEVDETRRRTPLSEPLVCRFVITGCVGSMGPWGG
jgi:glycosyl hydrolase family 57